MVALSAMATQVAQAGHRVGSATDQRISGAVGEVSHDATEPPQGTAREAHALRRTGRARGEEDRSVVGGRTSGDWRWCYICERVEVYP